jgi:DNA-damage-inducible protein J
MAKSAFIRARIEPELKHAAEDIMHKLGINPTQAVTMLYEWVARRQEWPLKLKIPNEKTRRAMKEADEGVGIVKCKDINELFKNLGAA